MGKVMFLRKGGELTVPTPPFPPEPAFYTELVETVTESKTWTAPESGYFQIDVFGASGSGGAAYRQASSGSYYHYNCWSGGGGGSGGYACSIVKLNKGDKIIITCGAVGNDSFVVIESTINSESYDTITITSGVNGTNAVAGDYGFGGAGGTASGGNVSNLNGNKGSNGTNSGSDSSYPAVAGGTAVISGGNAGGKGGNTTSSGTTTPTSGSAGFVKIYRGDTNLA